MTSPQFGKCQKFHPNLWTEASLMLQEWYKIWMGIVFQRHAWKLRIFALISICALDFLKIYTIYPSGSAASRMKRKENKQILLWISFYFYIFVILLKKILWHSVAIWERFESICLCERLPQLAAEVLVVGPVEVDTDGVLALGSPRAWSCPGCAPCADFLVEIDLEEKKIFISCL